MLQKNNLTKTKLYFGEGCRYEIIKLLKKCKKSNILLITSERSLKTSFIKEFIEEIQQISNLFFWTNIKTNPRSEDIEKCCKENFSKKISHIIGIGGGSIMDTAKAIAIGLEETDSIEQIIYEKKKLKERRNKLMLAPTTSGTGSELSYGSILTLPSGEKIGLRGKEVAADFAFVDPYLSFSMPQEVIKVSGFDAMTHAIETWISNAATKETEEHSKSAIKSIFINLPKIINNHSDFTARKNVCYSSMMMGFNLSISSTCMPHRLQYPIGASTNSSHGDGLAILYNSWLEHLLKISPEKVSECSKWLGIGKNSKNKAKVFVTAIKEFKKDIGMNPTVNSLGIELEEAKKFTSRVTGNLSLDPSYRDHRDIEKIYKDSLGF